MARVDLRITGPLWVPAPPGWPDLPRVNGSVVYNCWLMPTTIVNVREEDVNHFYALHAERLVSTPEHSLPAVAEAAKPTAQPAQPSSRIAAAEPAVTPTGRLTLSEEPAGDTDEGESDDAPKRQYKRKG